MFYGIWGAKVLKKFPKTGKILWTPLGRERYVCASLLPATIRSFDFEQFDDMEK